MNFKWFIGVFTSWTLLSATSAPATPLLLTIKPHGTNEVEMLLTPTVPGAYYAVMARTNSVDGHWLSFAGGIGESNGTLTITQPVGGPGELAGMKLGNLKNWTFVAGWFDDVFGDSLPPLYKELVLRSDPFESTDSYAMPMGDGWSVLQKFQNNWDPLTAARPPDPHLSAQFFNGTNIGIGRAVLTVEIIGGVLPDLIEIQRAFRTFQPPSQEELESRKYPGARYAGPPITSEAPFRGWMATNRAAFTNREAMRQAWLTNRPPFTNRQAMSRAWLTNRPPYTNRLPLPNRPPPGMRRFGEPPPVITGPFEPLATIHARPGVQSYTYVDTNINTLLPPNYEVRAHFVPPFRASLTHVDATTVRQTMLKIQMRPTTNGWELAATHPIPYARYLLLVRDQRDSQWRASGYFNSGSNREPVRLRVDSRGMLTDPQSPLAMPPVKFLPNAIQPEFTAGWAEDSDGDGLPDIYEVLVTGTDPVKADTGDTGVLDGYKEMSGDGWSALEKFRRRLNPLTPVRQPNPLVLTQPTMAEVMRMEFIQSDLHYEPQIDVRVVGTTEFRKMEQGLWALYRISDPGNRGNARGNFDVRISWNQPQPRPSVHGSGP